MSREYEFDSSGGTFVYFALSIVCLYLIPATISRVSAALAGNDGSARALALADEDKNQADECSCASCVLKRSRIKRRANSKWSWWTVTYWTMWVLFIFLLYAVSQSEKGYVEYDPYEVLGLERGATESEIRKHYRKLSKTMHPDKNKNDPDADDKWVRVAKAYESLTDKVVRENWEKYGNPDGMRSTSYGIALPQWIVEKDNTLLVVSFYLILLMVVLPLALYKWYTSSQKYDEEKQVHKETYGVFYQLAEHKAVAKRVLDTLCAAVEFKHEVTQRATDGEELKALMEAGNLVVDTTKLNVEYLLKARILLAVHFARCSHLLTENLQTDFDHVIGRAPGLLGAMIDIYLMKCNQDEQKEIKKLLGRKEAMKKFAFKKSKHTVMTVCRLSQHLIQAQPVPSFLGQSLLQLPHATPEHLKRALGRKVTLPHELAGLSEASRRQIFSDLSDTEMADIELFLERYPCVLIKAECGVKEFHHVAEVTCGAQATITITLKRINAFQYAIVKAQEKRALALTQRSASTSRSSGAKKGKGGKKSRGGAAQPRRIIVSGSSEQSEKKADGETERESTPDTVVTTEDSASNQDGGEPTSVVEEEEEEDEEEAEDRRVMEEMRKMRQKKLDAAHGNEDKESPVVHAPLYPREKLERWWLCLVDERKERMVTAPVPVMNLKKYTGAVFDDNGVLLSDAEQDEGSSSGVLEKELRFATPSTPTTLNIHVMLVSDSYLEAQYECTLAIQVVEKKETEDEKRAAEALKNKKKKGKAASGATDAAGDETEDEEAHDDEAEEEEEEDVEEENPVFDYSDEDD